MTLSKFLRAGAAALGALAVVSVSQANAADMYAGGLKEAPAYIPPPMWTGFYLGGHIGAAWEDFNFNRHEFDDGLGYSSWWGDGWTHHNANLNPDRRSDGDAFGGVQFGYNFQSPGAFVYGIEVDLGGMALNTRGRASGNTFWTNSDGEYRMGTPVAFDGDSQGGFYGDVTGRLGWTWGPAMIYAKGGFAWLNADLRLKESIYTHHDTMCGAAGWCDFSNDHNDTLTGWTVGGGIEWKVSPMWSIKAEYLHFEFDNFNNNCCNDWYTQQTWDNGWKGNNFDNHANLQVDTVKLGFNYFWSPGPVAPAPLK
jgi:outer membrane immunogenic protein